VRYAGHSRTVSYGEAIQYGSVEQASPQVWGSKIDPSPPNLGDLGGDYSRLTH
jgi:hypothetical protein